ncbi:hypothetical protein [Aneurinibacillus uraniidurans]|uniref:hypothetical protein n=1 Tax=Aneurinibacillus uraniidurans TaxID=2966586 RepID=UPI00234972F1|nr:hypothetical protein [Aneurinibacillus sp. B1]WCN36219.1 hypothetical protein PO771_09960 [Aneurinibacillus sp. B1]
MNIQVVMEKAKSELPSYKLVGYFEKGFPQYKRKVLCLMLKDKKLPVVDEFVLRLYKEDMELSDMASCLGIDFGLIENSWYNLEHYGLIDTETKQITELGHTYLQEYKIDSYEKLEIDIYVDALTGKITKNNNYMDGRSAGQINISVLNPLFRFPKIDDINKEQLKKVIADYKLNDPDNFDGSLIEILNIEGRTTHYKRMYVFIYCSDDGDVQFLVYEGIKRYEEYEIALKKLEEKGIAVSEPKMGTYFSEDSINYIDKYIDENKQIPPEESMNIFNQYLQIAKEEIHLSLPLIGDCTPPEMLIYTIQKRLKEGIKINLVISGKEFIDTHQKNQYEKIIKLRSQNDNLKLLHIPSYNNKILLVDRKNGIISSFSKHQLDLSTSKHGITEYGYSLEAEQVINCIDDMFNQFNKEEADSVSLDHGQLKQKIKTIVQLVTEFDDHVLPLNKVGWTAGAPIPNVQQLYDVPLCKSENQFKVFISSLHISFVESLDNAGKSKNKKGYFWNEFKQEFPDIHKTLHKIRLYRHSTEHTSLDDKNKPTYFGFLEEDLNGSLPMFVEKGYLILQEKLLTELEASLRNHLQRLLDV